MSMLLSPLLSFASGASGATWDAAFKDASITLSNGDLTAFKGGTGTTGAVRSTTSKTSGKVYFEVLKEATGAGLSPSIGLGTSAMGNGGQIGDGVSSWGLLQDGRAYHNGSPASYASAINNGDVVMVALDFATGKVWWGKNGTWFASGDPAAGTGHAYSNVAGTIYAVVSPGGPGQVTARFAAGSMSHSPPTGFSAWDDA
jgi:hypothetical protein